MKCWATQFGSEPARASEDSRSLTGVAPWVAPPERDTTSHRVILHVACHRAGQSHRGLWWQPPPASGEANCPESVSRFSGPRRQRRHVIHIVQIERLGDERERAASPEVAVTTS